MATDTHFVQQKAEQSTSSVSSFTTTTSMAVNPGNAIVVCMSSANTNLSSLVASDSQSDAFSLCVFKASGSGIPGASISIYVAVNCAGGATFFTVTPSAASFVSICAQEYNSMIGPSPAEATNTGGPTLSTSISPGAVNPASREDLYVSCWSHDGGASQAFVANTAAGWVLRSSLTNTANQPLGSEETRGSGSKTGSATLGGVAANWVAAVATFKMNWYPTTWIRPFPFKPGSPASRNPPYR